MKLFHSRVRGERHSRWRILHVQRHCGLREHDIRTAAGPVHLNNTEPGVSVKMMERKVGNSLAWIFLYSVKYFVMFVLVT